MTKREVLQRFQPTLVMVSVRSVSHELTPLTRPQGPNDHIKLTPIRVYILHEGLVDEGEKIGA